MSSDGGGIGSTLTGGIQDLSAILPLLGTEQCAIHVSSALTRGYLYAASAPMSIFGSLGVVSAGFRTLVACFSYGNFEGAKILGNMGFEPQGENLSLIMVEGGKGENKERYVIENRIDALIDELNIDRNRITGVSRKSESFNWNIQMMATTALLCALSITPYIYLNLVANNLDLKRGTIWVFPILRSTGGFITAVLIQLLIQRRITTISYQYLVKQDQQLPVDNGDDVEAGVEKKKVEYQMDARTWPLLCLLLIGLLASVVGYVGCFSVVQNSASSLGPVSWLCLEAGLSLMRLFIWACNPATDDAPPLEIKFELDNYEPLPTCNKDNEEILRSKVLPLTRARDFLRSITSFVGLIKPFKNLDLSLYYTLTRKLSSKKSVLRRDGDNGPENAENHKLGERTLYITVFDHKERTTRVYTRDDKGETFYSTKSDAPLVDVGHHLLEVEIDAKIDYKGDPVCSERNILESLREHHRLILEHIHYRLGAARVTETYAIENSWTMKVENTISTLQKLRKEDEKGWKRVVEKERIKERSEESLISDYFTHSSIEGDRRLLDEKRVKWIARRMDMISKETKERLLGTGVTYRVNMEVVEKKPATKSPEVKEVLGRDQYYMEQLLVYEVREWEKRFWNKFEAFLEKIDKDRMKEKERLTREWKANCWKRLNPQRHAALKRLADVDHIYKDEFLESLGEQWALSISHLFEGAENLDLISLSNLRRWIGDEEETHLRRGKEIEDIEFRLKCGSDSRRFDQFWDDDVLFQCRYSRSKWLNFWKSSTPLEVYSHALKGNENITHITFFDMDKDFDISGFLRDLPWVTSISSESYPTTPHSDHLFIKSINNDLNAFTKRIQLDSSTYVFSDAGIDDLYSDGLGSNASVLISFIPPTSGKNLILRVKHSGIDDAHLEVSLGSTNIQLDPSSKSSLTIDDLTLYPLAIEVSDPSESHLLSFMPKVRNDIVIRFIGIVEEHGHFLRDIELLDEAGLEYKPHYASLSVPSN